MLAARRTKQGSTALSTRIGINGFGRIGRQSLQGHPRAPPRQLEVVAVNDLVATETNAHLFSYDTTYGRYDGDGRASGDGAIVVDGHAIRAFSERTPPPCRGESWASTS